MIKKSILIIFLLQLTIKCLAQSDTTMIPCVAYWSLNESHDFRITKIKKQWRKGELVRGDSSSYNVNFKVIDSTENSYRIQWEYPTKIENTLKVPSVIARQLNLDKYKITKVIYKTDALGMFLEIENWKELSEMMTNIIKDLINISDKGDMQNTFKKVMQPFLDIYSSKEGIEQVVFKELQYLHSLYGAEYPSRRPIIYKDKVPNMLGGAPIKSNGKLYFENIDFENYTCTLKQELKLDPDDTSKLVLQLLKKMKLNNKEIKRRMKDAKLEVNENNRFTYYYDVGLPIKIENSRETVFSLNNQDGESVEIITIELIE